MDQAQLDTVTALAKTFEAVSRAARIQKKMRYLEKRSNAKLDKMLKELEKENDNENEDDEKAFDSSDENESENQRFL